MRIAFHAPLKSPDHPVPSGDRLIAALLMRALARAGHEVVQASTFRMFDGAGDRRRQLRLARIARRHAQKLLARWHGAADAPRCWFTYHLYHKAPDWIGPRVSARLGIPYLVAEASYAPRQAHGPWRHGHRAVAAALARADRLVALNPHDVPGLEGLLGEGAPIVRLAPFLDADAGAYTPPGERPRRRARLARLVSVDPAVPLVVCVAMMRPGRKADSFRLLAGALGRLAHIPWHLLVIGGGPAQGEVRAAFARLEAAGRVTFAGPRRPPGLHGLVSACDLFVWPALAEPLGMAMLEAQALGVPVVAGDARGVGALVAHGEGGWLVPEGDPTAFANAVAAALADPAALAAAGKAARARVRARHGLDAAARDLDRWIGEAVEEGRGASSVDGRSRMESAGPDGRRVERTPVSCR